MGQRNRKEQRFRRKGVDAGLWLLLRLFPRSADHRRHFTQWRSPALKLTGQPGCRGPWGEFVGHDRSGFRSTEHAFNTGRLLMLTALLVEPHEPSKGLARFGSHAGFM